MATISDLFFLLFQCRGWYKSGRCGSGGCGSGGCENGKCLFNSDRGFLFLSFLMSRQDLDTIRVPQQLGDWGGRLCDAWSQMEKQRYTYSHTTLPPPPLLPFSPLHATAAALLWIQQGQKWLLPFLSLPPPPCHLLLAPQGYSWMTCGQNEAVAVLLERGGGNSN